MFNQNQKRILFLTGITHFYAHFYMLLFPSLALWIRDDLTMAIDDVLNLGFPMYLAFGVAAPLFGWLGDRLKSRNLLLLMLFGIGLSSIFLSQVKNPFYITLGLAAIGFFASIYHPVGIGLISRCFLKRGKALGNNGIWGNLGIGLAPIYAGVSAYFFDWQTSLLLVGCLAVLLTGLFWLLPFDAQSVYTQNQNTNLNASTKSKKPLVVFGLMLCCMTLLGLCYRGTAVSLPPYFEIKLGSFLNFFSFESFSLKSGESFGATILVSLAYLFGITGQSLGGYLADKMDLRKVYFLFHAITLPFMIGMAFLDGPYLFFAALVYVTFALGMQPIENSLVALLTPEKYRSLAYALKFILVLGVGSFAVKLVGLVAGTQHFDRLFLLQSAFIAGVLILIGAILFYSRKLSFKQG